ncbi:MAG: hypothetical protein AB8H80_07730 [Planctomycetota bacterium]
MTVEPAGIAFVLELEPPLASPGILIVTHEAGRQWQFDDVVLGIETELPPGPIGLELIVAGVRHQLAARVAAGQPARVWRLP